MSSTYERVCARLAEKRRKLEGIKSANLMPLGSVNVAALVMQELRRQIAADEDLLANLRD